MTTRAMPPQYVPPASVDSRGAMSAVEILATLKKFGKPQTAAIYKRHGAGDNVFGTLTSEIAKLQKKIKVNHTLAMELWRTGNAEARILALQVSDPQGLRPWACHPQAACPSSGRSRPGPCTRRSTRKPA